MGDTPGRPPTGNFPITAYGPRHNAVPQSTPSPYNESESQRFLANPQTNAPQHNSQFPQPQIDPPFNMTALSNALPDGPSHTYNNVPSQRFPSGSSPSGMMYPGHNVQAFTNTPALANMAYNMHYQPQLQAMYGTNHTQQSHTSQGFSGGNSFYPSQMFNGQNQPMGSHFMVQPGQYSTRAPIYNGSTLAGQFGAGGGYAAMPIQQRSNDYLSGSAGAGRPSSIGSSAGSTVVRGPPRKPRQSGHAIWIGNLPPQTDLMSLVFHVCKETTALESLFLISKSNCAFANYKDEVSCAAAQVKLHDSRFQTVRLVSRLRRNSVGAAAGVNVPTGPAALSPPSNPVARSVSPDSHLKGKEVHEEASELQVGDDTGAARDKFFIVKSLTVEDLDLSVRNGIWATQSHNEDALNKAYKTADNVYLVFSANKSGEYYGYAKMISPINDDPAAAIEFAPKAHTVEDPELPKAIPTPANEFAPKGRIIDDSARGTIFWEVDREGADGVEEEDEIRSNSDPDAEPTSPSKAWGKPFHVEWLSSNRLPFYRTRGLRNPWNSNREVKIARDGTELETSVGRRLIALFHRLPSPVAPHIPGGVVPLMVDYAQVRPFQ